MNFNCLIVDDEPLARKVLEKHLSSFPQLLLRGSVENAKTAFEIIHSQAIHLLFLDIQMPGVDGLSFIRSMRHPPSVIFTTAYAEYAAESYTMDAIDYLLKPVSFERFERAVNKFLKAVKPDFEEERQFLLVKQEGKLSRIYLNEITYIEARKDYLLIHTAIQTHIKHMTMKAIEKMLPERRFKRVHRGFIASVTAMTGLQGSFLEIDGELIPIGYKYRKGIIDFFTGNDKSLK